MKLKINIKIGFWVFIIYLFVFERALISVWNGFSYIDEILAILTVVGILIFGIIRNKTFTKSEIYILLAWFIVCIIGIMSNIQSQLFNNVPLIIVDIISTLKVWLSYYTIILTNKSERQYDRLICDMAKLGRGITIAMFVCLCISQFVNIGMTASVRLGIKSFQFVYNVPGNYSKLFYFLIPLLSADLYYKITRYKKFIIVLALITWASSMRARAFAFIAIYIILYVFFFAKRNVKSKKFLRKKMKLRYIIPLVVIATAICWNQLVFYFTTSTQARSVLLRYGVKTMMRYFPLGSGFGTFGSDVAANEYSLLYWQYGFNYIYGMQRGGEYFLNDNYWPMIMGQFGILGTIIVGIIVVKFMRMVLKDLRSNKYFYFSAFCALGFLLLSSIASKSYSEFSSICVFMLMGVFVKKERAAKQQRVEMKSYDQKELKS